MNIQLNNRAVNRLLSGLLVSLLGLSGTAFAQVSEVESNDDAASAQLLSIGTDGSAMATGMVGTVTDGMTSDVDIYAFDATAGDVPDIAVTSADACSSFFDPAVTLFDENGNNLNMARGFGPFDPIPAGMNKCDALLNPAALMNTGRYYVVVTSYPMLVGANFAPMGAPEGPGGGYTLSIASVTPAAPVVEADPDPVDDDDPGPVVLEDDTMPISMEILHWRGRDRHVSKRWKRYVKRMKRRKGIYPVPVVMFSTEHFKATEIDPETLRFGVTGEEKSLFRCSRRGYDVNRDGMKDKICFFDAFKTGFDVDHLTGVLNGNCDGETMGQTAFTSSASLKVFKLSNDNKRKKWNKRKHRRHYKHHKRHSRWHRHHD